MDLFLHFSLCASSAILLTSCGHTPNQVKTITVTHKEKVSTSSSFHIVEEIKQDLPHSGVGGSSMVRICRLAPTGKGLKIVPESNYGPSELDEKEYTRLYCVIDFNDDEKTSTERKKKLREEFRNRKLPIIPIFLNAREYEKLTDKQLKNALAFKSRERYFSLSIPVRQTQRFVMKRTIRI